MLLDSPIIPNYSRQVATPTSSRLACIAVVLALPVDIWWLWSFTISIVDSFYTLIFSIV